MPQHTECRAVLTRMITIRQALTKAKGDDPDYQRLADSIAQHDGESFTPGGLAIMIHDLMGRLTSEGCDLAALSGDINSMLSILMDGLTIEVDDEELPFWRQLDFALCEQFVL